MKHPGGTYDMIISNPPYIPKADRVRRVSPSVRRWETPQALHLGQDGTAMHRHIIDMVATGHLGTKTIALELDGTSKQFSRVKGYAIEKLSGSEISALPDDHRRHRAILIEHIAIN
jgi:methylase of polypeptide subunit release factors